MNRAVGLVDDNRLAMWEAKPNFRHRTQAVNLG